MEDAEQSTAEPEAADKVLRERPRAPIGQLGYGFWLNPYINDTNMESSKQASGAVAVQPMQDPQNSAPASAPTSTEPSPVPEPRRRGRPRVSTARNESAIEKRRAQVRNAQRTYQKRKDTAAQTVNQRCDELLETLSTLSTEVEELLRLATKSGALERRDNFGAQMRRLCSVYDEAINSPSVTPELRLLQIKNHKRRAEHQSIESFRIDNPAEESGSTESTARAAPEASGLGIDDPSSVDLSLVRGDGTTMIQSFRGLASVSDSLRGPSIFDIVEERQAQFRTANNPPR